MQLVIGGAFQGKKDYVKNTFHLEKGEMQDGANASYEDIFSSPCLYHFHQWIRKGLEENWDLENLEIKLLEKNPRIILIMIFFNISAHFDSLKKCYEVRTGAEMHPRFL